MSNTLRRALASFPLLLAFGVLTLHGQGHSPAAAPTASPADTLGKMTDEVAVEVEKLRGWTFKRPVRRERVDVQAVRRHLQKQLDLSLPPSRRRVIEAFLKTAGLLPADCDMVASVLAVLDQQVAGYYDPAAATLYLVDRPDPMPEFMQRTVLAHELTHALDDQELGIGRMVDPEARRTEDADVVLSSLGEGSATALMFHYLTGQVTAGKVNPLEAGSYFARELERARALEQMPRYFNAMFGSYIIGAAFLAKGDVQTILSLPDDRGIGDSFRTAWTNPPRSSEQILHPEKYWDQARRDEPVALDDDAVEKWLARPGRQIVHRNTLGELLAALLTEPREAVRDAARMMSATGWTNPGAMGWGGDRFYLLAAGGTEARAANDLKDLKGVWVTAWDSAADRAEFVRALDGGHAPAGSSVATAGDRDAIVFIGFEAAEREALMRRVPAGGAFRRIAPSK